MAEKPQQKAVASAAKQLAKEVVKLDKITKSNGKQHPQKNVPARKWRPRQAKPNNRRVTHKIKRELHKQGLEGPASRFRVTVSATIGKVGPNKEQGPELQIATFLHPSLVKEPNDGSNFGPLQAAAAQWGLWRISDLEVRFTPLVGSSAVTGSVTRASLNLTQSPGATSWGGLGARKHLDVPTGVSKVWKLRRGDLTGPRQTWWVTDTNEEGGQSCGPMLEVHGLGKTTSTYKDSDWTGDLFIVELHGTWEFSNYNAKPALGMLERVTDQTNVELGVDTEGQITMTIPENSPMARHMGERFERASASNASSVGETIWQIVDEGAGLASSVAPAPFGWLIKGGWWFVKKILGRAANAGSQYLVYASLADAQNGKPAMSTSRGYVREVKQTILSSTQLNAPNTGPGASQPALAAYEMFPYFPHGEPAVGQPFYLMSTVSTGVYREAMPVWVKYNYPGAPSNQAPFEVTIGQTTYQAQTYFKLTEPVAYGADIPEVTSEVKPALNGWYTLDTLPAIGTFQAIFTLPGTKSKYGDVVAASHFSITPQLMLVAYLVRVTTALPNALRGSPWSDNADNSILYYTPLVNAYAAATSDANPIQFTPNRACVSECRSHCGHPTIVAADVGEYILALVWCRGNGFSAGVINSYGALADTSFNLDSLRADSNGVMTLLNRAVPYSSLCALRMTRGVPPTSDDELVARILGQLQTRLKFAAGSGSSSEDDLSDDDDFECLRSTPLQQIYEGVRGLRGHAEAVAVVKSLQSRGHAE
ncbi:capsid protein precursor [Mamastrovirus 13]|uniref:Capsid polyprotein VP86 n=1 Tax=Ovine astrovirus 1 TaxID=1239577 RepID=CAPSD_OASV1|nr:capsid protein precursor [Mamastrovirus 13]Q9JH65.1 RecName: Full=Capsid polyprotein VP90 [Mamastrovirus 13]CAB95004.1 capsid protein precursor [Mamastrovirus 13]